jgi:type VII ESX secretion system EccD-like protein
MRAGSTKAFLRVDAALTAGTGADQAASNQQARSGDDALGGLVAGMAAVLMAASCALGISKRIAEYR